MNRLNIKVLKPACQAAVIVLFSVIVGTLLMIGSFCLPDSRVVNHVGDSVGTLSSEGNWPDLIKETEITMLDNFTDAVMLNTAAYSNLMVDNDLNLLERAMLNPRAYYNDEPIDSLAKCFENKEEVTTVTYPRYWHGYVTYLRPLLVVFDYNLIRLMLFAVHIGLGAWFLILLNKRCGGGFSTVAFVCVYIMSGGFVAPFSLQFTNVMIVTQISGIVLLLFYDQLHTRGWVRYFFLLTGVATTYLDLLTFPIVSLGVNLCLYVLLENESKLRDVLALTLFWCIGYFGMWFGKWVIAFILTGENIVADAISEAQYWRGIAANVEPQSYLDIVMKNATHYGKKYLLAPFAAIFVIGIVMNVQHKNNTLNKDKLLCLVLVMALPFCWYLLLRNQCYVHHWMTFRSFWPLLLAVLLLPKCFDKREISEI